MNKPPTTEFGDAQPVLDLGSMVVRAPVSPKMAKALATISAFLHDICDSLPGARRGYSRETCLHSSLCVAGFLRQIGFTDAKIVPCYVVMIESQHGEVGHTLGIGVPGEKEIPDKFNGHAVVVVPSENLLIDVTIGQARRPQWRGALAEMLALSLDGPDMDGRLAGVSIQSSTEPNFEFQCVWRPRPDIDWRSCVDAKSLGARRRREKIVAKLIGTWVWR